MIDTYRAMNKHFIPTGYELSGFAKYLIHNEEFSTPRIRVLSLTMTSVQPQLVYFLQTTPQAQQAPGLSAACDFIKLI